MTEIRYVEKSDKDFWFSFDKHLSEDEFEKKVRDKTGYVLFADEKPCALLRYNLFWDNTPFCTMLFVDWSEQKKGYGKALMEFWESDMKEKGFHLILVSTQVDETSQHFYRKLGYKDCGALVLEEQPMEMFFQKALL